MILPWNRHPRSRTVVPLLVTAAACLGATASVRAQERARFPITSAQIASAMLGRQLPTKDARIVIAAPITALSENPQLEVQSMQLVSPHELRLRISCRNHAECLSFFALATYPEPVEPATLKAAEQSPKIIEKSQPKGQSDAAKPASPGRDTSSNEPHREPALRAGAPVMLQIDGDRIHILVEVICLEGGAEGDRIRVATRDHKETYVARIVNPTLVKGTL